MLLPTMYFVCCVAAVKALIIVYSAVVLLRNLVRPSVQFLHKTSMRFSSTHL